MGTASSIEIFDRRGSIAVSKRYYVAPGEASDSALSRARFQFLAILEEEHPDARAHLRDTVAPLYRKMRVGAVSAGEAVPAPRNFVDLYHGEGFADWLERHRSSLTAARRFAGALDAWINANHLQAPWLRDAAIRTIQAWELNPSLANESRWFMRLSSHRTALLGGEEADLRIWIPSAWEPTVQPRSFARKEILSQLRKALDQWLDERERLVQGRGYVLAPDVRQPEKHTRWLVRYQVVGESYTSIARDEGLAAPEAQGRQTVADAVRAAAERLGLQLRPPDQGGRPAKPRPRTLARKPAK